MPPRRSARIAAYEAKKDQIQDEKLRQLQATLKETTSSNEDINELNRSLVRDINYLKLTYYRIKFGCENRHKHQKRRRTSLNLCVLWKY